MDTHGKNIIVKLFLSGTGYQFVHQFNEYPVMEVGILNRGCRLHQYHAVERGKQDAAISHINMDQGV